MQKKYYAFLGSRAEVWSHRGYNVNGGYVYCDSWKDAVRVVRESLGRTYRIRIDGGELRYVDLKTARTDNDGTSADAVIGKRLV